MTLIVSTAVNGQEFRAESCRWISMVTVAPFYPKCAISQTMKRQRKSVLQYNVKQDFILISKKMFFDILNLDVFCDIGMAIPQIKFVFFLAFKQSVWSVSGLFLAFFGFLLNFSSGNPESCRGKPCKECKTHRRLPFSCVLSSMHTFASTQMRRCL